VLSPWLPGPSTRLSCGGSWRRRRRRRKRSQAGVEFVLRVTWKVKKRGGWEMIFSTPQIYAAAGASCAGARTTCVVSGGRWRRRSCVFLVLRYFDIGFFSFCELAFWSHALHVTVTLAYASVCAYNIRLPSSTCKALVSAPSTVFEWRRYQATG
jgi:hypothetical protein